MARLTGRSPHQTGPEMPNRRRPGHLRLDRRRIIARRLSVGPLRPSAAWTKVSWPCGLDWPAGQRASSCAPLDARPRIRNRMFSLGGSILRPPRSSVRPAPLRKLKTSPTATRTDRRFQPDRLIENRRLSLSRGSRIGTHLRTCSGSFDTASQGPRPPAGGPFQAGTFGPLPTGESPLG
jgi:hypothetical protein